VANVKISQLPAATLPPDGTELIPVAQSGITEKMTVDGLLTRLTAAPPPIGTTTSNTANFSTLKVNITTPITGVSFEVQGTQDLFKFSADNLSQSVRFFKSRGTALAPWTTSVNNGDALGVHDFYGADGLTPRIAARIASFVDGTPGTGTSMPGNIVLYTTPNGSTTLTEHARLTNAGKFGFNKTTPTSAVDTTSFGTNMVTNVGATYTVLSSDHTIIQTTAASTYTLPDAALFTGRVLQIATHFGGAVTSASSNVVPLTGGSATNVILGSTDGSFVTLQSNGTNWVVTAKSENSGVINVKDLGAIGDGVADDTVAIQAALTLGGTVLLPSGTYKITTSLTMTSGGLIGMGASESVITMASAALPAIIIANGAVGLTISDLRVTRSIAATAGGHGISSLGNVVSRCNIEQITLDAHWYGLALGPTDYGHVGFVRTESNYSHGLYMTHSAAVGTLQWVLEQNLAQFNDGSGYYVEATSAGAVPSVSMGTWTGTTGYANTQYGIAFVGVATSSINGIRLNGGFIGDDGIAGIYFSTHGYQHTINDIFQERSGATGTGRGQATAATNTGVGADFALNNGPIALSNCRFTNNSYSGITSTAAGGLLLTGCTMTNNGDATPVPAATDACGVKITAGGGGLVMSGCFAGAYGGGTAQQYGVSIGASITQFDISDCYLTGNIIAPILDSSGATITKFMTNNLGLTTNTTAGSTVQGLVEATDTHSFKGAATISTNSASPALKITQAGAGNAILVEDVASDTTPFLVDASGRVVIGNTSVITGSSLENHGLTDNFKFSVNAVGQSVRFFKSRGTPSAPWTTPVVSGDNLGVLDFYGADGTTVILGARITATVDGTPGANDMPGRLVFSTTADGASSPTERMRIDSGGFTKVQSFGTNLVTNTAATYTVLSTDHMIVQTTAASVYTLPAAASFTGRRLHLLTQFAGTVTSASSNVVPIAGGAAGTAILTATAGKYALLQSNGTNWLIVAAN